MSSPNSTLTRMHKLFRPGGVQLARKAIIRSLAQKYLTPSFSVFPEHERVLNEDHPAARPAPASGPLRIHWILPGIFSAAGGLFNIFRTIHRLESWGHQNHIYVLGSLQGGSRQARDLVRKRYFPINADIELLSGDVKDSDVLIATAWPTAYAARSIANTARKFYFVQDLEHMFYPPGSLYEFARATYTFGFQGITAGSWISDVLRRDYDMDCTPFSFSYDREAYASTGPRTLPAGKKRVLFYARPETERRGFELGILTLYLVSKAMPEVEFVLVGFPADSVEIPFPAITPGVLSLSSLGALYRSCDVALVLSHTNLSLLPLELMACGCAVVSNSGANTEWLLNSRTARLAPPEPKSLARVVMQVLEDEADRKRMIEAGLAFASSTDWTREIKVVESALLSTVVNATPSATNV